MSRQELDKMLNKWISRKLLVFLIACLFLCFNKITNEQWLYLTVLYVGVEAYLNKNNVKRDLQ